MAAAIRLPQMPPPTPKNRPFEKLADDEIRALVDSMAAFPNVLGALFREVCERRFEGWLTILSNIQARFAAARNGESARQLQELADLKKAAEDEQRNQPRPAPPRAGASGASWEQTAAQVRHARVIAPGPGGPATPNPLSMLGYGALPELPELPDADRHELLYDFVAKAQFAGLLPPQELADWGQAMTAHRIGHTASQLGSMRQLATRGQDIDFLELSFGRMLSPGEWKAIRALAGAAPPIVP